jgi:esterase/lipase
LALSKVIGWVAVPTPDYNDSFRISKAYTDTMNHPLQHVGPIYMSTVLAMMRSCDEMKNNLQEYKLPMLIFRVGVDSMVSNVAIEKLYENAGSQDKTLIDYPNAWHSIQKDPEVYDMCKRAIGWMEARL